MMKYCKPKLTDNGSLINVSVMSNALFNTKLVGILQININSDHALLTHFSVHPDYRRIGVGKSMMMKLVEYLQQQNFIHPILVYPCPSYDLPLDESENEPPIMLVSELYQAYFHLGFYPKNSSIAELNTNKSNHPLYYQMSSP